ncbi:MAG: DEAD/DEAH box helicase family protein [Saprospiraceae bacterium]|nr:DEAD/DEAH box helicase family protein [Saprospiraceae bacterium]
MNEADTRANYTDPQLKESKWEAALVVREHFFTAGRKLAGGKRAEPLKADYLLRFKGENLAVIEAKQLSAHPTKGLEQAKNYAAKLKLSFAYCTNGAKIYEFDMTTGKGDYIDAYPTPDELYQRIYPNRNPQKEAITAKPYLITNEKKPRYYQELAINRAIQAITEGKKRVLLTLATGTGKTIIAFQLVHKLFEARWNLDGKDRRPKVLFLADRNILADQAINTFNPLEKDLVKINGEELKKRGGKVPTNFSIYFAIYQAISEKEREEVSIGGYFRDYPKDFFDLVIIDECHRGSANEEGSWRAILDHFDNAVHLGMTATPKRDANVDTYNYFGKPVYEYSLKEGVNDGFLTPYKVKRIQTSIDTYIHTSDDTVTKGQVDETKVYSLSHFEREIVIPQRTELIAKAILQNIRPLDKTIVFCVDQPHAAAMRDYLNKHKTIADANYCVRITSDEGDNGKRLLKTFQDNDKDIPTILTSSQMLTTGVDARNVRNIVLVRNIGSIVEFKQIIGRGTRLFDGKDFFTILDFTGASENFYDDEWDGLPSEPTTRIKVDDEGQPITIYDPPEGGQGEQEGDGRLEDPEGTENPPKLKIEVRLSDSRTLRITNIETRYIGADGKPMSATEFVRSLTDGVLPSLYHSEEQLREIWQKPETRKALLDELERRGLDNEHLEILQRMFEAQDCDIFDVLNHVSYSRDMITRKQRAAKLRGETHFFEVFTNVQAKDFLHFILERYEADGVEELERDKLSELIKLRNLGTASEAAAVFGGRERLLDAFYGLQRELYKAS